MRQDVMQLTVSVVYHEDHLRIGESETLELGRTGRLLRVADSPWRGPIARLTSSGNTLELAPTGVCAMSVEGIAVATKTTLTSDEIAAGTIVRAGDAALLHLRRAARNHTPAYEGLLGDSHEMHELRGEVLRVAVHDVPVLILGESGTGKELIAEAIHAHSTRSLKPLVRVNMAAIPESMASGELFGHRKGAFTGATGASAGYFGAADGGSLFLDEVGDTPQSIQASLLRVLSFGELQRVGESRPVKVDVRIIAATDADIRAKLGRGGLRLPLLMRLGGYEIQVPPLRARREDIAVLLVHFLAEVLADVGATERLSRASNGAPWLPIGLFEHAFSHAWPGNVRELRNLAQRIAIAWGDQRQVPAGALVSSLFVTDDFPARPSPPTPAPHTAARRSLDTIDRSLLERALRDNGYRPTQTARALGISRTSLYVLIERHAGVRKAGDLGVTEIEQALASARNVHGAAAALAVSERGLRLRLRALGIKTHLKQKTTTKEEEQL